MTTNNARTRTKYSADDTQTARAEAVQHGLYFDLYDGEPENYFLSTREMTQLRAALETIGYGHSNSAPEYPRERPAQEKPKPREHEPKYDA